MGAFSAENEGDAVTYIVGFLFLILIGVGAKWLADLSSPVSSGQKPRELLIEGRKTLVNLEMKIEEEEKELTLYRALRAKSSKKEFFEAKLNQLSQEATGLTLSERNLLREISNIEEEKASYRKESQLVIRQKMKGQKLESLELPSGQVFNKVIILGVDEVGMRIIHQSGSSRIPASDLPEKWREEFDFSILGSQTALLLEKKERAAELRKARIANLNIEKTLKAKKPVLTSEAVRLQLQSFQNKRTESLREASLAEAQALSSRNRSGPDGLETWSGRASRFRKLAASYQSKISHLSVILEELEESERGDE